MKMVGLFTGLWIVAVASGEVMATEARIIRVSVTFNNVAYDTQLTTSWGFSSLIEGAEETILFDTGGNGNILLGNMRRMNKDPMAIDTVFLSHIHTDHTGGLEALLRQNPNVHVYLPESFPASFKQAVKSYGAQVTPVHEPTRLLSRVHSSGEMGDRIKEHALILETSQGLIIISGCAHPGIVNMVKKAKEILKDEVYLVMGGFHLGGMSAKRIRKIINMLKELGVRKVAPSHCTGEKAIALFRKSWGDNFLEGGLGAIIELPQ
jgi:7,8-dihydropterin-6-yl-methyl-4-(beta-D-ribofuranosyl)aminobenzene 5'-phosphate synthase